MAKTSGVEYLRKKMNDVKPGVDLRFRHYDMSKVDIEPGITIPLALRSRYRATLGWAAKSVDSLADRLSFREFGNDMFRVNDIFQVNNPDTFFDAAILSALISSCSFVYVIPSPDGPKLQVIEGNQATGVIDPTTGLLKEGYAVLERDEWGEPAVEAHFLPGATHIYRGGVEYPDVIPTGISTPLLVPIVHRPDAVRPFGRSRISRSAMYLQRFAKRTLERSDITAEFYSFPQKYILGLDPNSANDFDTWKATISSMLAIGAGENGEKPSVGQFTSPSMSPFTEQLRTAASLFAGETGLTIDDLGFVSDNPSSSEAIKASHETLRSMARKAQKNFGSGFLNVGYTAACLRDQMDYRRSQFYKTQAVWDSIFEPDASTMSLVGDAAIKINQAVPGYFTGDNLRNLTGIEGGTDGR